MNEAKVFSEIWKDANNERSKYIRSIFTRLLTKARRPATDPSSTPAATPHKDIRAAATLEKFGSKR